MMTDSALLAVLMLLLIMEPIIRYIHKTNVRELERLEKELRKQ